MTIPRSAPTLNDVAQAAGVSTATVSRCLNTPERVIDSTRERVMKAVQELGYTPNFGARVMAARRTNTIGAIIPTMENAVFARGLQAFQEGLRESGFTLLVASSSYRSDIEEEQIRALVARGADGLLLIGHDRDPAILAYLQAQNIPVLVAWSFDPGASLPSVGFDNRRSMQALAAAVIGMGHRRIGVISAITRGNDRARLRLAGIRDAVALAGLGEDAVTVIETTYAIETGAEAFEALMTSQQPPTVVMCGNDVLAVGAMKKARELGLDVPRDVSITGFDDIELASLVDPALTTVHVPHREMGRRAARALIEMVDHGRSVPSEELAANVCMRGSVALPGRDTGATA